MATTAPDRIPGTPSTTSASPNWLTAIRLQPKQLPELEIVCAGPNPLAAVPVIAFKAHVIGLGLVISSHKRVARLAPSNAMLGTPKL
jgi:hypothetical protein